MNTQEVVYSVWHRTEKPLPTRESLAEGELLLTKTTDTWPGQFKSYLLIGTLRGTLTIEYDFKSLRQTKLELLDAKAAECTERYNNLMAEIRNERLSLLAIEWDGNNAA